MVAKNLKTGGLVEVLDIDITSLTVLEDRRITVGHENYKVLDVDKEIKRVDDELENPTGCYCGERSTCHTCEFLSDQSNGLEKNRDIHQENPFESPECRLIDASELIQQKPKLKELSTEFVEYAKSKIVYYERALVYAEKIQFIKMIFDNRGQFEYTYEGRKIELFQGADSMFYNGHLSINHYEVNTFMSIYFSKYGKIHDRIEELETVSRLIEEVNEFTKTDVGQATIRELIEMYENI